MLKRIELSTGSGDATLNALYQKAIRSPGVVACDVATSDVWYSGRLLGGVPDFRPERRECDIKGYRGLHLMADGSISRRDEKGPWRDRYKNINGGIGRLPGV